MLQKFSFLRSNIILQADIHVSLDVARPYEKKTFQEHLAFFTTEVNATILRKKQVYNSERRVSSLKRNNNNRTHTNKILNGRFNNRRGPKMELGPILHEVVEENELKVEITPLRNLESLLESNVMQ